MDFLDNAMVAGLKDALKAERESRGGLNQAQFEVLREWASWRGRKWKQDLAYAWADGDYSGFDKYGVLQEIRNQFGPTWLDNFHFPGPARFSDPAYVKAARSIGRAQRSTRRQVR